MMRKAVRLRQVAEAAGVSLNTASRAIRGDRYVSCDARARVPEDVSVIGFDDVRLPSYVHPQLTTMRHPSRDIAVCAVHRLVNMIAGGSFDTDRNVFPPELVVRQSTGPVKSR